jgi:hypothetical protein
VTRFLDHNITTIVVSLFTVIVLFGDDARVALFTNEVDNYVDTILLFCWLVFIVELVLSCLFKDGYWFSFFFWMDIVSIITLPSDIYYLTNSVIGTGVNFSSYGTNVARAGRASRVGTKVARLIRVIRLIRLIRVAKFVK